MRNDLILLLSCLILSQSCSLDPIKKPPLTTTCISSDGPSFACYDKRLSNPRHTLPYAPNYVCRNPQDYDKMFQYMMYLRKEAEKCR
jgi:hypothetical protein